MEVRFDLQDEIEENAFRRFLYALCPRPVPAPIACLKMFSKSSYYLICMCFTRLHPAKQTGGGKGRRKLNVVRRNWARRGGRTPCRRTHMGSAPRDNVWQNKKRNRFKLQWYQSMAGRRKRSTHSRCHLEMYFAI